MAGIYIHIPFCKQACHYCNFHFSTSPALQNDFTEALLKEMDARKGYLDGETIETIYFGGGTPSNLPDSSLSKILESVYRRFPVVPEPEITLESNPDDMDPGRLSSWKEMGINRLSIGIQSFFDEDLIWMNRAHHAGQALLAIDQTIKTGFKQFSLDLIYGSPGLTDEKWQKNLKTALSFNPPHISCYALTVEPKTALYKMIRMNKSADVQPEKQAVQFLNGIETLESAGYEHYEISSFAIPGNRSRHNSSYWHSKKYLGLGPSAHSFNGMSRQWNIANNALYIKNIMKGQETYELEVLQPRDLLNEYIMTSLRTREGLELSHIRKYFGEEKARKLESQTAVYIQSNKMENREDRLILTTNGKLFADGIAAALFFD
jgi:oxygen-independent coproporphyrinogen III oxidase